MADDAKAGKSLGMFKAKLKNPSDPKKKAFLFVPEGADVNDDLDVEVVALDAASFEVMGPRRT